MPIQLPPEPCLPPEMVVLERGWLSANNIVFLGNETAVVDTGYATHASQTVALVEAALEERTLSTLINTHLHSDHCGGNAALQRRYPNVQTCIPPGQADLVRNWDSVGLTYAPTGQQCPPFHYERLLQPGADVRLGSMTWQVHAAAGHDPHSVILFQAEHQILISADALWERGFGVVFPELDGVDAFAEVGATLDLIEQLAPRTVIPGHGRVFTDVSTALGHARKRLEGFVRDPRKHALHGAKVLFKFKLLELQRVPLLQLLDWASQTPQLVMLHGKYFADQSHSVAEWGDKVIKELLSSGAAVMIGEEIMNA